MCERRVEVEWRVEEERKAQEKGRYKNEEGEHGARTAARCSAYTLCESGYTDEKEGGRKQR